MPRLGYAVQITVFYLFGTDPRTGLLKGPAGTGVFVSRTQNGVMHVYAVTAYHVAVKPYAMSQIRINTVVRSAGSEDRLSSRIIPLEPDEWKFIPGSDDLAAVDVTDKFGATETFDFVANVDEAQFATQEFIDQVELGEGEDGFMIGMFTSNPGDGVNVPAVRFGNISQMAHPAMPLEQGNGQKRPSHVFDMRSRPGYSGSPVFVYRTPDHDLTTVVEEDSNMVRVITADNMFVKLLGIHSGQFQEEVVATMAEAYGQLPIHEGDKLLIPSSMTVVVPASRISDLLNLPQFEEQRKMREQRPRNNPKVIPEGSGGDKSALKKATQVVPDSENNPDHLEDFNSLLGAAAKARSPEGQT